MWKTKMLSALFTLVLLACLTGVQAQSASNVANVGIGSNVNQQISHYDSHHSGMTHSDYDWLSTGYIYRYPSYYYPYYYGYYPYTYSYYSYPYYGDYWNNYWDLYRRYSGLPYPYADHMWYW